MRKIALMLFHSFDDKKHKVKGVKLYLGRQESFWKSISDSMENHYRHAWAYSILTLAIFCLLGIFLRSEPQNTTWNSKGSEREPSLMEGAGDVVF